MGGLIMEKTFWKNPSTGQVKQMNGETLTLRAIHDFWLIPDTIKDYYLLRVLMNYAGLEEASIDTYDTLLDITGQFDMFITTLGFGD
jgi:hypothetical protein